MLRLAACLMALVLALPAQAQEKDVLSRLMAEPLTLFDWGLANLDRDIASAARRAFRHGVVIGEPRAGSIYDWRARRITLYVAVGLPAGERTQSACAIAFTDIVATLTDGAPAGRGAAGWYLLNAFRPKAHFWASRFEDVGTKLLDVVRLEISFVPGDYDAISGDTRRVRCVGRLDAAPSEIVIEMTS